jgi:hypothetical protein
LSQVQSRIVGVPIGTPFNPAEIELAKVEQLHSLAVAIFCRSAAVDERNKEIFKINWTADFSKFVGRARGVPSIADPSLQQGWRAASAG